MTRNRVVIIGSGLGGLSAGVMLARKGFDVTVLEQGSQVGGCLQCFERDGVRFETGMHVVGSMGRGEVLYNHLDHLGILDKVEFSKLDSEAYDIISLGGEHFRFANGRENMMRQMLARFSDQGDNLRRYWSLVDSIASMAPLYGSGEAHNECICEDADAHNECINADAYMERSLNGVVDEIISDPLLQQVLVGNIPLYAAVKDKTPFSTHAFVADFYNRGAYRVVGGSDTIAVALREKIEQFGGRVFIRQRVTHVNCEGGKAKTVVTDDGNSYSADIFISDIHPQQLLTLFDAGDLRNSYADRIRMMPNTQSVFSLFLKFKPEKVPYLNSNFFCYRSATPWTLGQYSSQKWPDGYLFMHNCHKLSPQFAQGGVMLAYMNFADVARWSNSRSGRRGDAYEAFKQQKAKAMIAVLNEEFPGIADNIESYYTATPLTYRDYTSSPFGSMYGILHDIGLGVGGRVSYRTKIPNLFLVGQNINAHGILGVLVGSYNACGYINGNENQDEDENKNQNQQSSCLIIGGGLGGLITGALLAKRGERVKVLEKNRIIGGGLQMFKRYGHCFPTGMHVFGGFQEGGIMKNLCDELGISDKIDVHSTDTDCFDEVVAPGVTLRLPCGKENYIAYLSSKYPHESDNIRAYVDAIYALTEMELAQTTINSQFSTLNSQFLWPADKLVAHYVVDPELRAILSYLAPLYSGIRGETPAYIHAIVNVLHIEGSFMFKRGSQQMADALASVICQNGGEVCTGEEVVAIETSDHNVSAVVTASGKRFIADRYISSLDPQRLVAITDRGGFPSSFRNRINSAEYGYSAFKVFISLKQGVLPHVNHPRYYINDGNVIMEDVRSMQFDEGWPHCMMAVTAPDKDDEQWAETMTVMIPTSYNWFECWQDSRTGHRPVDYYVFKEQLQQRAVEQLEARMPMLHNAIDKIFSSTPLTIRDYLGVPYGSLYGFHTDCNHPLYTKLSVNTKLHNLHLTGQNVNLHGMCGVAITAMLTANADWK